MIRQHSNGTELTFLNGYSASMAFYDGQCRLSAAGITAKTIHLMWTAYGGVHQDHGMVNATELAFYLAKLADLPTIMGSYAEKFKETPPRYLHNRLGAIYLGRYDRTHLMTEVTDDLWYQDGKVYARFGDHHHDVCDDTQEPNHPAIKAAFCRAARLGLMEVRLVS